MVAQGSRAIGGTPGEGTERWQLTTGNRSVFRCKAPRRPTGRSQTGGTDRLWAALPVCRARRYRVAAPTDGASWNGPDLSHLRSGLFRRGNMRAARARTRGPRGTVATESGETRFSETRTTRPGRRRQPGRAVATGHIARPAARTGVTGGGACQCELPGMGNERTGAPAGFCLDVRGGGTDRGGESGNLSRGWRRPQRSRMARPGPDE